MVGLAMNPVGAMEASNDSFGVISNIEVELIDNVILLEDDCNYLNLIADCISETSQAVQVKDITEQEATEQTSDKARQAQNESCSSVEVVSETCKVHKYYSEAAATVVENHFIRSFAASEMEMNEKAPVRKTGEMSCIVLLYIPRVSWPSSSQTKNNFKFAASTASSTRCKKPPDI